jgi:WD40 repeat protein
VWDATSGAELAVLRAHLDGVTSVAFSPDGRRIVSGSSGDNTVRVWDAENGECLEVINGAADAAAIAAGAGHFPWRAIGDGREMVLKPIAGGPPIAWFSVALYRKTTHPNGRIWAGGVRSYLCLFQLEGLRTLGDRGAEAQPFADRGAEPEAGT